MSTKVKLHRTMSKAQLTGMILLVVVLCATLLLFAFLWLYRPNFSPAEQLPFSTDPVETAIPHVRPTGDDPPVTTGPSQSGTAPATSANSSSGPPPVYKQREEVYNFLLIGHDRAATLADVIMLVNYDVKNGVVSVMQFPRDTYYEGDTSVPALNVQFSALYNRAARDKDKKASLTAAGQFARMLEQSLCIKIHYAVVMNLDGFVKIVDAIGGVDIDVPANMDYDDPYQNLYIHLKKGMNHLTGAQAEGFVRFRSGYEQADIGRVNAQKIFMTAFIRKLKSTLSSANASALSKVVNSLTSNVSTDLPAADALYFVKNALNVSMDKITMMTVPCDYAGGLVINRAATLQAVNTYFNVYDNPITDAIFDRSLLFVNENHKTMYAAYTAAKAIIDDRYTADDINKSSITIPRN